METPYYKPMANDVLPDNVGISVDTVADEAYNSASEFISSGMIYLEMKLLEGAKNAGGDEAEEAAKTIEPLCERVMAHLNASLDGQVDLFQVRVTMNGIKLGFALHVAIRAAGALGCLYNI